MASRGVAPTPRGKPSGLPFHARFTDVAEQAGLRAPVIYGPPDRCDYILETMGCGVAFLDYDNDGWLDIFVLTGTRLDGAPPGATNRLYKNNRDGTFTDVTEKAGLHAHRLGVRRDGRRLQQRRLRRPLRHLLGPERALPQQRRRHVHRCHQRGRPAATAAALGLRLHLRRLRPRRPARPVRLQLPRLRLRSASPRPARTRPATGRACRSTAARAGCRRRSSLLYHNNGDGTFTDVSEASGIAKVQGQLRPDRRGRRFRQRRLARHLRRLRLHAQPAVPQQPRRHVHRGRARSAASRSTTTARSRPAWASAIGDYNLDGNLDIFKTHFADDTTALTATTARATSRT